MRWLSLVLLLGVAALTMAEPVLAAAPSDRVARMCRQKALDAYPAPRIGSPQGVATQQREIFRDCVAKMQEEDKN